MTGLRPLATLAWRESRFARRRLFLFLSSIALGVAALVATESFSASLAEGVRGQARTLLGADLALGSRQAFGPRTEALLDSLRRSGVPSARVTSFASMALLPRSGATRLVQVRAVEGPFPFYGEIETRPAGVWQRFGAGRNAVVDPALLLALGARLGDTLALGDGRFRIAGTLQRVPGDVGISSVFGPRVYIPSRFLEETGLVGFGSRVEYDAYLRLPAPGAAEALAAAYGDRLQGERVRFRTVADQQERLGEAIGQLGSYLGLIGIFALLLGGIGVASAMRAYIAGKTETVATLRCLGATAPQVLAIYLLQATGMGIAGSLLGAAIGLSVQWVIPRLLADLLPVEVALRVDFPALALGVGVGVWVAIAFALLPLLGVRRISPLQALRRRVEEAPATGRDPWAWGGWLLMGASVLLLIILQVGEARTGAAIAGGIAATLGVLWLAAWAVARLVRRLPGDGWSYPVRQGIANLHRPANQTRVVMVALGFGVFLLATLYLVQDNLLRPLRTEGAATRANLVFFDVQEDQEAGMRALLRERGLPVLDRAPIVPMRVAAVNGQAVAGAFGETPDEEEAGDGGGEPEGWATRREYRSTFRDTLVAAETLVTGEFGATSGEVAPVSLERDIAGDLGVGIGDRITWDVQGVRIPTRITSIREVDWARFEPNFFAVFPPEVLAGAPHTWVLLTRVPDEATRARLQSAVVARYPNVSALDLTQVLRMLDQVIGRVSAAIRFLAAFSVATGFVVLLAAVATSRLQRVRESVLLRTLGATRGQIRSILLTEYLVLGALASLHGIGLAVAAGWALARWTLHVPFALPVGSLAILGLAVVALAVGIGAWAGRETFRHTPLEALREE